MWSNVCVENITKVQGDFCRVRTEETVSTETSVKAILQVSKKSDVKIVLHVSAKSSVKLVFS